jgi:hypothetical protein
VIPLTGATCFLALGHPHLGSVAWPSVDSISERTGGDEVLQRRFKQRQQLKLRLGLVGSDGGFDGFVE